MKKLTKIGICSLLCFFPLYGIASHGICVQNKSSYNLTAHITQRLTNFSVDYTYNGLGDGSIVPAQSGSNWGQYCASGTPTIAGPAGLNYVINGTDKNGNTVFTILVDWKNPQWPKSPEITNLQVQGDSTQSKINVAPLFPGGASGGQYAVICVGDSSNPC